MIEVFLIGYACGIITLIFLADLDARKKREKRDRKTSVERIIACNRKANDISEISKLGHPKKR